MSTSKSSVLVIVCVLLAAANLMRLQSAVENEPVAEESGSAGIAAVQLAAAARSSELATQGTVFAGLRQDSARAESIDALTQILQELPSEITRVSVARQEALAEQLQTEFGDFLAGLEAEPERAAAVRSSMLQALTEIAQISAALQSGQLTSMQLDAISDPNHVVNRVSGLLEPDEITALEDQIESRAHNEYLRVVSPQLETMASGLTPENRELLLQTFYAERSDANMPFGIGALVGPGENLDLQLKAVNITREQMRLRMTPAQFSIAEAFLDDQEKALVAARIAFSPLR